MVIHQSIATLLILVGAAIATQAVDRGSTGRPASGQPVERKDAAAIPQHPRLQFWLKLRRVTIGMRMEEVRTLFRAPVTSAIVKEQKQAVLNFGVLPQSSFPTLGYVVLGESGRVVKVVGQGGDVRALCRIVGDEALIEDVLTSISHLPRKIQGNELNPLDFVAVVNKLVPLGRDASLAIVREYIRIVDGDVPDCLYLIPYILFPDCQAPLTSLGLGAPEPPRPTEAAACRTFPIVIVNDYPLVLIYGFLLAGRKQPLEHLLTLFEGDCKPRVKLLCPHGTLDVVMKKISKEYPWVFRDTSESTEGSMRSYIVKSQLENAMKAGASKSR